MSRVELSRSEAVCTEDVVSCAALFAEPLLCCIVLCLRNRHIYCTLMLDVKLRRDLISTCRCALQPSKQLPGIAAATNNWLLHSRPLMEISHPAICLGHKGAALKACIVSFPVDKKLFVIRGFIWLGSWSSLSAMQATQNTFLASCMQMVHV